jgi:PPK2 family polyphosphate:nucleotide phosphotransferase
VSDARARFRARAGLVLREPDAGATPLRVISAESRDQVKEREREQAARLGDDLAEEQAKLYAGQRHKLLIVLQGMDTSGKDGTIKHLFTGMNPMGLNAVAFKAPSELERAHDFLWRIHPHVPAQGQITVFNRSHYEDVLITRVLGLIDQAECQRRYAHIRAFERMLAETGTTIMKVFLHLSRDEQRRRLQERIDKPDKRWKFDPVDLEQRKHWDDYQRAYEDAIGATDTDEAPWYVIPADSKTHRNLMIATLLKDVLLSLGLRYPDSDPALARIKVT